MQDDATVWLLQFSNTWMHLGFPLCACARGLCELGTWAGGWRGGVRATAWAAGATLWIQPLVVSHDPPGG